MTGGDERAGDQQVTGGIGPGGAAGIDPPRPSGLSASGPSQPAGAASARAASGPSEPGRIAAAEPTLAPVREQMRQQMLTGFGGVSGMVISAVPTVVFIAVNAISTLRIAVVAAVASALALTGYRLARHQSVQQALSGLFGVLLAAVIAGRTGQARGYFLVGIWSSALYGAVFLGSLLVRRPLVGAVWEFLDPTPAPPPTTTGDPPGLPWRRRPHLAKAYYWATAAGTAVFAARAVVQGSLFEKNATGWLAVTRIAMGYPLTIAAAGFGWFVVRRARRRLVEQAGVVDPAAPSS